MQTLGDGLEYDPVILRLQAEGRQSKPVEAVDSLRRELETAQRIITLQGALAALLEQQVALLKARLKTLGWPPE